MTIDFIGRIDFKIPNAKNDRQSEKNKKIVLSFETKSALSRNYTEE